MTFKITSYIEKETIIISFQGYLDTTAVKVLREECEISNEQSKTVRIVLRKGTEWEFESLNEILQLENIIIEAESPLLNYIISRGSDPDRN